MIQEFPGFPTVFGTLQLGLTFYFIKGDSTQKGTAALVGLRYTQKEYEQTQYLFVRGTIMPPVNPTVGGGFGDFGRDHFDNFTPSGSPSKWHEERPYIMLIMETPDDAGIQRHKPSIDSVLGKTLPVWKDLLEDKDVDKKVVNSISKKEMLFIKNRFRNDRQGLQKYLLEKARTSADFIQPPALEGLERQVFNRLGYNNTPDTIRRLKAHSHRGSDSWGAV